MPAKPLYLGAQLAILILLIGVAAWASPFFKTESHLSRAFIENPIAFSNGTHDDLPLVIARATQAAQSSQPTVFLIGTSALRDASWDQDQLLAYLQTQAGWPAGHRIAHLGAASQSMWAAWALTYLSQPQAGDSYYLFLSPVQFNPSRAESMQRFMASAPAAVLQPLSAKATIAPPPLLRLADGAQLTLGVPLTRRYIRNTLQMAANHYFYADKHPLYLRYTDVRLALDQNRANAPDMNPWQVNLDGHKQAAALYAEHHQENFQYLEQMIALIEQRGARVFLLPQPLFTPDRTALYGDSWNQLFESIQQSPLKQYLLPALPAPAERNAFVDSAHMNAKGRDIWSLKLATLLLQQQAGSAP